MPSLLVTPELSKRLVAALDHLTGPDDLVLLTGSVVVGLSQGSSDFDLFLIRASSDDWSELPSQVKVDGVPGLVEIEVFGAQELRRQAAELRRLQQADNNVRNFRQEVLVRYSALVTSRPLYDPDNIWPALLNDLSPGSYQAFAARWHRSWRDRLACLAVFLLRIGDLEAADAAMRAFVAHTLDAMLVDHGEIYFSPKYRFEKLRRACLCDVADQAWPFHVSQLPLRVGTLRERLEAIVRWAECNDGFKMPGIVPVPALAPGAALHTVGGEHILVLGSRCWIAPWPVAELFSELQNEQPWELALDRAKIGSPHFRMALRFMSRRGILQMPLKLGRWATWI